MQEAVKFPRATRASEAKKDATSPEGREGQALKITLERPESIEALKSAKPDTHINDEGSVPWPMAAKDFRADLQNTLKTDVEDRDTADAKPIQNTLPEERSEVSTAQPTPVYEPFDTTYFARTFIMIVATIGSILVAAYCYASLRDLRGQLATESGAKASAEMALAESKSRLAATEKQLSESQSRLAEAEKVLASVRDALATVKPPTTPSATTK